MGAAADVTDGYGVQLMAAGKVNLSLEVLGRRADGYHEIRSVMMTVGLADRVRVGVVEDAGIEVECDDPEVAPGSGNLAYRAADVLRRACGIRRGARIALAKRIPVGGGMGGGSSDAAAVMVGLNRLWGCGLGRSQLVRLGARVGSDVPFFFHAPSAIVCGRGERVDPISMQWSGWAVLVRSLGGVSTRAVYARWLDKGGLRSPIDRAVFSAARSADALAPAMRNDLEPAVFEVAPQVRQVHRALAAMGRATFRVSGAGSVLFDLFDSRQSADAFADRVRAEGIGAMVATVAAPQEVTAEEKHAWKSPT